MDRIEPLTTEQSNKIEDVMNNHYTNIKDNVSMLKLLNKHLALLEQNQINKVDIEDIKPIIEQALSKIGPLFIFISEIGDNADYLINQDKYIL